MAHMRADHTPSEDVGPIVQEAPALSEWCRPTSSRLRAGCGAIITPRLNRAVDAMLVLIQPRFRPHCGRNSARGRRVGMQHVIRRLCQGFVRRQQDKSYSGRVVGLGHSRPQRHSIASRRSRGGVACGLRAIIRCQQKFRICRPQPKGIAATQPNGLVRHQRASCSREEAYPVRPAQRRGADTDCFAGNCQLLHGGPRDGERRKVRYERSDRRASYLAVWHPVAGDERRDRAIRDSSGQ